MLLPDAAMAADACDVLVAVAPLPDSPDAGAKVVGAIAATRSKVQTPLPGPRVCVHVIMPFRGRGVGGALARAMAAAQCRLGAQVLYAWSLLRDPSGPEAMGWRRLGFTGHCSLLEHEIDLSEIIRRLEPVFARAAGAGRIPADLTIARYGDLTGAHLDQITKVYVTQLGGTPVEVRTRLERKGPEGFHRELSTVLLQGGNVIAFMLGHLLPDVEAFAVDAVVVDPAHRGGWANILIKLEPARRGVSAGVKRLRFQTFDHNRETRAFTGKLGARLVGELVQLYRMIDS
jgi:hypothetical protein